MVTQREKLKVGWFDGLAVPVQEIFVLPKLL
jgi:hypothetical protein